MRKAGIFLFVIILFALSGCSRNTGKNNQSGNIEYVYVPSFYGYNSGNLWINWINDTEIVDDKLIVVSIGFDGIRKSIISAVDISTGEISEFDMQLDERRFVAEIMKTEEGYVAYTEEFMTEEEHTGYGNPPWKASYLTYYDESFNILNEVDITDCIADITGWSTLYYECMTADGEGNVYVHVNGCIYAINKNGSLMAEISPDKGSVIDMECVNGNILALYSDFSGKVVAAPLNVAEAGFGEKLQNIPECSGFGDGIKAGEGDILYFFTTDGIYEYNLVSSEYKELAAWMHCDITGYGINNYIVYKDSFICTEQINSSIDTGTEYDLIILNKVNKADVKEKTTLTVTMLRRDDWLMDFMISFNRRNPEYRFEAVYYTEENSPEAMEAAVNQFNMDLINGEVGDIIIVTPELDYYNLAAKGTFASLDELIEQDEELDKEDFIENVMDLLRVDGTLYGIGQQFSVSTLVGKKSNVGQAFCWNVNDVMNMLSEHKGSQLLYGMTKENALKTFLMYSMGSYYDSVTGECSFNGEEFKKLLALTAQFSSVLEEDAFVTDNFADDVTLLERVFFNDVYYSQVYRAVFGEEVNFIGYPVDEGSGSVISFGNGLYTINAQSQYKEAAWQYIRQFISEDYQNTVGMLPIDKNVFESKIDNAVNTEPINHSWNYLGLEIKLEPLSMEDADFIRSMVYGAGRSDFYDYQMMNIILEEAAAYYAGAKSADEAAEIIQSRIQVYVDERR